jgi:hypothetical protein
MENDNTSADIQKKMDLILERVNDLPTREDFNRVRPGPLVVFTIMLIAFITGAVVVIIRSH